MTDIKAERFFLEGQQGKYYVTIGLEIHAQIVSETKLFSGAPTVFGGQPNTQVSFVDAAFPGMLPVVNQVCVLQALKTGLALEGRINLTSFFDRKNYFYPDLPQGYQITQFFTPIMEEGKLAIPLKGGGFKDIRIERLHIEQDAGKSMHDQCPGFSVVDLNRAGVGLMEIVSAPDMTCSEEAAAYVKKVRAILMCVGSCDGNMERGNLRVDANVSVALPGAPLGTRVELKNLNSTRFLQQAIASEAVRQIQVLESGGVLSQQTRLFDPVSRQTKPMREKEDAAQYRYFPDPDLPPLVLKEDFVEEVRRALPELPDAKKQRFQESLGISEYDAALVTAEKDVNDYFELALRLLKTATPKMLVNWLMGDVIAYVNKHDLSLSSARLTPGRLVSLLEMIAAKQLSGKMAKALFEELWETDADPKDVVQKRGLAQISSEEDLLPFVQALLTEESEKVAAYHGGKQKLFGYFVGQLMKKTAGKANPELLTKILKKALSAQD